MQHLFKQHCHFGCDGASAFKHRDDSFFGFARANGKLLGAHPQFFQFVGQGTARVEGNLRVVLVL